MQQPTARVVRDVEQLELAITTASEYGGVGAMPTNEAEPRAKIASIAPTSAPTSAPTATDALPQIGEVIAGRYRIEREIGRGGMGIVYAASQLRSGLGNGRMVALKWLFESKAHRSDRQRRFLREARTASSIQHSSIVRVYDAGKHVGTHAKGVFLVMELLEGESLRVYMQRELLTAGQAVDLLMPALRGIDVAHRKGIVHRDLKPDNLLVCKRAGSGQALPEIKVLDFGLSKLLMGDLDSLLTLPGAMLGTPQYMAPEQAGGSKVDARADVYSLGVILYEAVAGRRPFEALTLAGLLQKLAQDEPPHLRAFAKNAPAGFANAVMRALHRDPARRYASVEAFAKELEPYGTLPFVTREIPARMSALPISLSWRDRFEVAPVARKAAMSIAAVVLAACLVGLAARSFVQWRTRSSDAVHPVLEAAAVPLASAPAKPYAGDAKVVREPAHEPASDPIAHDLGNAKEPSKSARSKPSRRSAERERTTAEPTKALTPLHRKRPMGLIDPWEDLAKPSRPSSSAP